ncbi:MAG: ATP-binding protein [Myxococcota bacterium]|jgi:signal transduction histidine kinase
MKRKTTVGLRRGTAVVAVLWACVAIGASFYALFFLQQRLSLPMDFSFVTGAGVVAATSPEATRAGIRAGDRVLSVDGRPVIAVVRSPMDLDAGVANHYEVRRPGGEVFDVVLRPLPAAAMQRPYDVLLHVGLLSVAVVYVFVVVIAWLGRPDRDETFALLLFGCTASVVLSTGVRADLLPWSGARALAVLPWLGATSFHLFTTYPVQPRWLERRPGIRAIPYLGAVAISIAIFLASHFDWQTDWPEQIAFFYGVAFAVCAMGILASERRRANRAGLGERTDLMLAAGLVSFLPGIALAFLPLFAPAPAPWYVGLLSMAFFPLAISYGMVRRQLFDFRLAARSSAAYGVASLVVTGAFAGLVAFTDEIVLLSGVTARSVQVVALFFAILAFNPVRARVQSVVDRVFDRNRARHRRAVGEVAAALVSVISVEEIRDRILDALTTTMGVRRAMLMLYDEETRRLEPAAWRGDWPDPKAFSMARNHPLCASLAAGPKECAKIDFEDELDSARREMCQGLFDSQEVELLTPILFGNELLGVIAVGKKVTGDRIGVADRELLRTLANQGAIGLENAKAFEEIAQLNENLEARVEERSRELREIQAQLIQSEKLTSLGQLVAGVAHELNNPIGFVHANLQLLDEYIDKLLKGEDDPEEVERLRTAISKLLSRSREGTLRVKEIVQDLRTFSRMDQAELQEADLCEELDRTLTLMKPRLREGIEVVRDFEPIPLIRCYPGQLDQVLLNLLMNACDAMPDGGKITLRTRKTLAGIRVEILDTGPGIAPEHQSQVFDPFFTTKAVGQGTGLGLSISHGIVERHGGRIRALANPEGGALFSIELPLDVASVAP